MRRKRHCSTRRSTLEDVWLQFYLLVLVFLSARYGAEAENETPVVSKRRASLSYLYQNQASNRVQPRQNDGWHQILGKKLEEKGTRGKRLVYVLSSFRD